MSHRQPSTLFLLLILIAATIFFVPLVQRRNQFEQQYSSSTQRNHGNDPEEDNAVDLETNDEKLNSSSSSSQNESDSRSQEDSVSLLSKYSAFNHSHNKNVLNIHVVPHTHDDVGWLKTVDQYYTGANRTIQHACVRDILDSVVPALLENEHRTFVYVEMKFFSMWWNQQTDVVKDQVRFLIQNNQFTFANGGWCMHDEATSHYMGMLDQTSLGHSFLKQELGVIPKVGWQLDPFGHSATQASLMTKSMGFDALFFGRIDHQELEHRQRTRNCEGLWKTSNDNEDDNDDSIFWGLTGSFMGNYQPPNGGFCFDIDCDDRQQLISLDQEKLKQRIELFLQNVGIQASQTRGNHVMVTMGSDFQYQVASRNYANLDALISNMMYLQATGALNVSAILGNSSSFEEVHIFYSSPEYYTQCKHDELMQYYGQNNMKQDTTKDHDLNYTVKSAGTDFFPYASDANSVWTGYFTSRPSLKRMERVASAFLLAARQILSYSIDSDLSDKDDQVLFRLEDAHAVLQHHDGVSGTSKQHVAYDYAKTLHAAMDAVATRLVEKLRWLFLSNQNFLSDVTYCPLLNETICPVSQNASQFDDIDLYVLVYNSLGTERSSIINLPVSNNVNQSFDITSVSDSGGGDATAQTVVPMPVVAVQSGDTTPTQTKYVLSFATGSIPPVGAKAFRIRRSSSFKETTSTTILPESFSQSNLEEDQVIELSNGILSARFDRSTGVLQELSNAKSKKKLPFSQKWGYYLPFDETLDSDKDAAPNERQNSGAYVFRPSQADEALTELTPIATSFVNTSVGYEVHVEYDGSWVQTVTRILPNVSYIEVEYTVGPVPISEDGRGKEVVTRFDASIHNEGVFYTDSNGRAFLKRTRNARAGSPNLNYQVHQPISGNYYPVTSAIFMEDKDASLVVLTDRSQGGSSIQDGSIELMVQRRTLKDDHFGVGEPLNETTGGLYPSPPYGNGKRIGEGVVIKGTHRILFGDGDDDSSSKNGASLARSGMDDMFAEPLVFVGSSPSDVEVPFSHGSISALKAVLPSNIMLVTYKRRDDKVLLRLAHQYGREEDSELSQPVTVDLEKIFPFQIENMTELTLSANQDLKSWEKRRLNWMGTKESRSDTVSLNSDSGASDKTVVLHPMEIKTFQLKIDNSS